MKITKYILLAVSCQLLAAGSSCAQYYPQKGLVAIYGTTGGLTVTNATTPAYKAASAVVDLQSTSAGFLVPRMTESQRNAIASPATSLLVYQTDATKGFWYYNDTIWAPLDGGITPGAAGESTWVQYNDAGEFSADSSFRFYMEDDVTPYLSVGNFDEIGNSGKIATRTMVLHQQDGSVNTTSLTAQTSDGDINLSLPSDVGTENAVLSTDGFGNLIWTSVITNGDFNPDTIITDGNVDVFSDSYAHYSRVGDIVTYSGGFVIDPNSAVQTAVVLQIPIPTTLLAGDNILYGTSISEGGVPGQIVRVSYDLVNLGMRLQYTPAPTNLGSQKISYIVQYAVN